MIGKKGIGTIVIAAVVGVVIGGGITYGLFAASGNSVSRTLRFREVQMRVVKAKLDWDHWEHLINDSAGFAGEEAAWKMGRRPDIIWQENKIPSRGEINKSLLNKFESTFGKYLDKIKDIESDVTFLANRSIGGRAVKAAKISDHSFWIKVSPSLETSLKKPDAELSGSFNLNRSFDLRYGLLYERAKEFARDQIENNLAESVTCTYKETSRCGECPSREDLKRECKKEYTDRIENDLNSLSVSDVELVDVKVTKLQTKPLQITDDCYNSGDCCDYCGCSDWNSTASPSYCMDCGACGESDTEPASEDVPSCGCSQHYKKGDGRMEGDWVTVKFALKDPASKILTNNGRKPLKFIRKYNTTI